MFTESSLCPITYFNKLFDFVKAEKGSVKEVTPECLYERLANGVTLLDIYAPWCPPCQRLSPLLNKLAHDLRGKVSIIKIDGSRYRGHQVLEELNYHSFPTLILYKDGKEVRRIYQEERSEEKLKEIILENSSFKVYEVFSQILGKNLL